MKRPPALVLAIALLLLGVGLYRRLLDPLNSGMLATLPPADSAWRQIAISALSRLTEGTAYQNNWQLAATPRKGWITVSLIDSEGHDASKLPRRFVSNCTYVGRNGFVVCDVALLRRFLGQRALDVETVSSGESPAYAVLPVRPLPPERLRAVESDMLMWVLGHEIGHIVSRHAAAHFIENRFEDSVKGVSVAQEEELQADAYLASRLSDVNGRDQGIYLFLAEVLNREISRRACPERSPVQSCPNVQVGVLIFEPSLYLRYSTRGSHPEYIVRMVRLIDEAHRRHDLGLLGHINGNVRKKLIEEGTNPPG